MKFYLKNMQIDFLNKPNDNNLYTYTNDSKLFILQKDQD